MRIVKLQLDEESLKAGIDAVALVENPAIEEDFFMFAKEEFQSFTDYPQAAVDAAKQGIKRNEALNNKCGTQVGKVRAQQLAQRQPITLDTVKRMFSFLSRQKDNYDLAVSRRDYDACGYISYLLWGGPSALTWSGKILRQQENMSSIENTNIFNVTNNEAGNYIINGEDNPELNIVSGQTYTFNIDAEGHPFWIKTTLTTGSEDAYNEGVENNGTDKGTITFTVPENVPSLLYYNCEFHDTMNGRIQATQDFNLEDACLPGYRAIGLKEKDGRMVPNCVPINLSKEDQIIEGIIKEEMKKLTECKHNYISDLSEEKQDALINALNSVGITEDDMLAEGYEQVDKSQYSSIISEAFSLASNPDEGSVADFGKFKVLYKYVGPRDNKNRDFCSKVLDSNLLFRKEDINELSVRNENEEFGFYDIFKWRGSFNCRHIWQAQLFSKENTDQKRATALLNILSSGQSTKVVQPETGQSKGLEATNEGFAAVKQGDQQILVGPLMIPNKLIPRRDKDGNEYMVYFDEETVEKLAYKSMFDKIIDRINIEHTEELIDDVYLAESWLVKDPENDKANFYGYKPKMGTWMGILKVDNKAVWDEFVKTGKVKGFSVEGYFVNIIERYTK